MNVKYYLQEISSLFLLIPLVPVCCVLLLADFVFGEREDADGIGYDEE